MASPLPFALRLLRAPLSALLEAQPPEINDQTRRKSGHTIDEDIGKANEHNPMH
jgi:hypothetical protein